MKIIKESKQNKLVEDTFKDTAVEVSDGGATIDASVEMTDMSADAKPATKADALRIENALTRVLDRALADAEYALDEETYNANCNVLVTGLPGSSKTATIRNWCRANGCNLYYLDSKNPDLQLLTSGAASIDRTDPAHPVVNTAYSNALAPLDRPKSILFLDELNRQVKEYIRGSLLTLIADRCVAGDGEEGFRYFPNLLFTIAAINPPKTGDKGAARLNDAELRRFYFNVNFNSEVQTTKSFFKGFYDHKITEYVKKHPELTAKDIDRINSFCLRQWLGNKIISNDKFFYTTIDEYTNSDDEGQILCQSKITELIDHSKGDLRVLKDDISSSSALNKKAKEMLLGIVETIILPNVDDLRARKAAELGLDLSTKDITPAADSTGGDDDSVTDDDLFSGREDDEDYAGAGGGGDVTKAKESRASDRTIEDRLRGFLGGLK